MGYSCGVKADCTLNAIESFDEFDYTSPNYKYSIEIGRENTDLSITGTVYELIEALPNGEFVRKWSAKKIGTFKITKDGQIVRFAGLSKRLWCIAEIAGIEAYDREYSMCSITF